MKPRDYEQAWHTLKESLLAQYPVRLRRVRETKRLVENHSKAWKPKDYYYELAGLEQLGRDLTNMDNLDGTQEFANLKHDLERGSE